MLEDLDSLEKAVDIAQGNVTEMVDMVPMVHDQFKNNVEQLNITQQNALDAHNKSQTAQKVCTFFGRGRGGGGREVQCSD